SRRRHTGLGRDWGALVWPWLAVELVEERRIVAIATPLRTARLAVRLLADEVPGPNPHQTVGPIPALRPELRSLHVAGLPNARRVPCVTAEAKPSRGSLSSHSWRHARCPPGVLSALVQCQPQGGGTSTRN